MEKIYEEKSSQRSKKNSLSLVLSFVVAIFAIVSLIAVGFNQISYAAEDEGKLTVKFGKVSDPTHPGETTEAGVLATAGSDTIYAALMFTDTDDVTTAKDPIFCIQHGKNASADPDAYTSGGEVYDDNGLIYILNQSKVLGGPGIVTNIDSLKYTSGSTASLNDVDKKALEMYATQIAIWKYMDEKYSDTAHGEISASEMAALTGKASLRSVSNPMLEMYPATTSFYDTYVARVVAAAKTATNAKTVKAVLASESIGLVGDSDIYQTDKISVVANPSQDLVGYYVDLYGLDGAYLVDKDGNKKTSLDKFAPNDIFYIRVPSSKIKDNNKTVKVQITGEFTNYVGGEYYMAGRDDQAIVKVTNENYRVWNEASIDFMVTPPTGMTTAQTIYFIGLIVLLCGVGIIYANAKPVEEK